jgi:hypothetical protein
MKKRIRDMTKKEVQLETALFRKRRKEADQNDQPLLLMILKEEADRLRDRRTAALRNAQSMLYPK